MTMTDKDPLESYFEAARETGPAPSGDLMARVLADADAVARAREAQVTPPRRPVADFLGIIGGWRGAVGLSAAAVAGLVIGIVQPDTAVFLSESAGFGTEEASAADFGFGFGFGTGFDSLLEEEG